MTKVPLSSFPILFDPIQNLHYSLLLREDKFRISSLNIRSPASNQNQYNLNALQLWLLPPFWTPTKCLQLHSGLFPHSAKEIILLSLFGFPIIY